MKFESQFILHSSESMLIFNVLLSEYFFFFPKTHNKEYMYYIVTHYKHIMCVHVQLFATPWTVAHQAPLSMGFSRQEYWRGWSFFSPGDLPDLGIKPTSPVSPAPACGFFTTAPPEKPIHIIYILYTNIMYKYTKYISSWLAIDNLYQKKFLQDKITLLGMIH